MATAPRVIGIIVCVILVIASLAFIAPAAISLAQANKGKGTRIGLAFVDQKRASLEEIKQTIKVLGSRMSQFGASNVKVEPSQTQGEAIQVLLPPGTDVERAKPLLTNLGLLELQLVAKGTSLPYATKVEAETATRALEGGSDRYEVALYRPGDEARGATTEGWVVLEKTPVNTGSLPRPLVIVSEQAVDASRWTGGFLTRILISGAALALAVASLIMLARSRTAPTNVYWPQTYGQSG